MIENIETFQLFVEVAVVVAGFAGVATVFGGQERSFEIAENLRLRALFQNSGLILFGCLGVLTMDAAGIAKNWNIVLVSLAVALINLVLIFDVPLKAVRLRGKDGSSVTPASLVVAFSQGLLSVPLLMANATYYQQEWLLILVFSYNILMSLWVFFRLLVNRN